MTETRTINITAYRDPDGHPTCATAAGYCQFLGSRGLGQIAVCMATGATIDRKAWGELHASSESHKHYLRPNDDCVVWK